MGRSWTLTLLLVSRVLAFQHHLFTSSISTPHMFALEFDDDDNTIVNIANMTAHGGHPWLSFSYDKGSLYAGEADGFASYTVENVTSLLYKKSIQIGNTCGPGMNGKAPPYVIAEQRTPFNVFGAPIATCGAAMSVDVEGGLDKVVQAYKYNDRSNIQGLTLDPENSYLYSADEGNNGIWTHAVTDTGTVQQVGMIQVPFRNAGVKKVVVHPNGRYLYAILSRTNKVIIYAINHSPTRDTTPLTYTGLSYDLLPEGFNPAEYATDEIYLSADANVLFVTARYRVESARGNNNPPAGYIRAILLTALSEQDLPVGGRTVGPGFPIRPLFHLETRTSGGLTNAVSPAPWANEYFALADSQFGLIEIWKIENLAAVNYTGELAQGAASPPQGGWVAQAWSPQGAIQTVDAAQPAQPTPPPSQSGAPFGRPQPKANPTPAPQPPANLPWNPAAPAPQPKQTAPLQMPWQTAPQPKAPAPKQPQPKQPQPQPKQTQPFNPLSPWSWGGNTNANPAPGAQNTWPWGGNQQPASGLFGGGLFGGGAGTTPAAADDDDEADVATVAPKNANGRSAGQNQGAAWADNEDDGSNLRRRKVVRSRIARLVPDSSTNNAWKRQAAPATSPDTPTVVNIVASWQAPTDGGKEGRRLPGEPSEPQQDPSRLVAHQRVKVKPWTGSKKRSPQAEYEPIQQYAPDAQFAAPVEGFAPESQNAALETPEQVQQQSRGCCGNAIWFD